MANPPKKLHKKLPYKPLLAAAILFCVFLYVDLDQLLGALLNITLLDVVILLAISAVMIWLSCMKWALFVRASGKQVPVTKLMRFYTEAYFYNSFLPSYVGGDIARSYSLGTAIGDQRLAATATFLERLSGLLAMAILAGIGLLGGYSINQTTDLFIGAAFFGALIVTGLISTEWGIKKIGVLVPRKLSQEFQKLSTASAYIREKPQLWVKALGWSLLFHGATVVNTLAAAYAVGWETAPVFGLFMVLPVVLLITAIPITPGNLGIQESAFLFFLSLIGATSAQAFGVGIVLRIKVLFLAVLGGFLWARRK